MRLRSMELFNLAVPVTKPYHTAFGDLAYFDTVLVILRSEDEAAAGESCPVKGYSWEGIEDVWAFTKKYGP